MIRVLRKNTGADIRLDPDLIKDGLVPVTIKGQAERCTEAKERIDKLLANHSETTILVPEAQWGLIVGKGGSVIKALKQDTHTQVSAHMSRVKDGLLPVTIKGQVENCAKARQRIEELLPNHSETTVWVPEAQWGRIVGKGGAGIKALEQDSHTRISAHMSRVKDGLVPVTIKGQAESCTDAKDSIEQLLANQSEKLLSNSSETTLWVPEAECGLIIGAGGAIINDLRQATGTSIILDESGVEDGLVPVTLLGPPERCAEAKEAIEELLTNNDDYRATTITIWVSKALCGEGGEMITTLQKDADIDTHIGVDIDLMNDGLVPVTINGPPDKCIDVKERIEWLLDDNL